MRSCFVFGSNEAGIHCSGSALAAKQSHGAIEGQGVGWQGDSYAIPTLSTQFRQLPLTDIARHVANFLRYAVNHRNTSFNVVAIGCGVAGFTPHQIAPMFAGAPKNVNLPPEFQDILQGECHA
jgi:hypothetical protein